MIDDTTNQDNYSVKLESFEGPLDLLLHLIKKNEIDIYDIPIALIIEQYNEYLDILKEINLEIVGDYLIMAAELGYIKSKMLVPKHVTEEEEEVEDPREELVRRLIEYQRYKDAAQSLFSLDILGRDIFARKFEDESVDIEEHRPPLVVDLWSLVDAFKTVIENRDFTQTEIEDLVYNVETVSVEDKMEEILQRLEENQSIKFYNIFHNDSTKTDIVVTFLALLELIKQQLVKAMQEEQFKDIVIIYYGDALNGQR